MGLSSSLFIGVAGLTSNAEALSTISNNIANVNTTAYKRTSSTFQQLVAGKTYAGTSGAYNGAGVVNRTRQFITQTGQMQRTNQSTDMAISGNGFFVVADKPTGLSPTDVRSFTRLGDFIPDTTGYLKNSNGQYLLAWPQDSLGNIEYDVSDLTKLHGVRVTGLSGVGIKSTDVSIGANFNAEQTLSAGAATYDATLKSMANYAANPTTGTKPDFEMTMPIIDSKGGTRTLTLSVIKTSTPNEWIAEIRGKPGEIDPVTSPQGWIAQGKLKFNPDGSFDLANSTLFGPAGTGLSIGSSTATTGPRWSTALGIEGQNLTFELVKGLRQNTATTQVNNVTTNGSATGNLQNISVQEDGTVSAIFDNGAVVGLAKLAVATFNSADSLSVSTGGSMNQTVESGGFNLKLAGLGGAGTVASQQLEASNVDMTSEFTGLITVQRAYSASSKIITTADQMLDELINIKR